MTTSGASPFAIRGVIEGFYGNPWTHEQRLDLIGFIAARGMNTFVYGPKDDSLVRRDWREPYGGPQLERIGALIDACRRHDVEFVYCLSPGLSIQYANGVDLDALSAKFDVDRGDGRATLRTAPRRHPAPAAARGRSGHVRRIWPTPTSR